MTTDSWINPRLALPPNESVVETWYQTPDFPVHRFYDDGKWLFARGHRRDYGEPKGWRHPPRNDVDSGWSSLTP